MTHKSSFERKIYQQRLDALRERLSRSQSRAVLAASPANIYYYTGFSGEDSWMWVSEDAVAIISDGRYAEQIAQDAPWCELWLQKSGGGDNWLTGITPIWPPPPRNWSWPTADSC